jgi:lipopolysaccharide export system permease protein
MTLVLTDQFIPWARANIQRTVTSAMEDIFLDMLRSQMQVVDPMNGISVTVMGVKGKTLLMPTFRHSLPGGEVVTLQAQEGSLEFDLERQEVILHLVSGHLYVDGSSIWFNREKQAFPLPRSRNKTVPRELTVRTIERELKSVDRERETLRNKQLVSAVLALSEGDFEKFRQPDFLFYDATVEDLRGRYNRLHTEVHSRFALSCSCLFFVLLGSPFSMLQARRQFLTSFILCFLPILLIYYPVVMLCINLSKENDYFDPTWAMWIGNGLMFLAGMYVLRRLLRN